MDIGTRLNSLDAFRGFDMFWIMGGSGLVYAVAALCGCPDFNRSFGHVAWEGLQFMDTVFPTFLFLAGASFPFSAAKSLERGLTRGQVARRALRRGVTLFLLGIVYNGFLQKLDFANFRVMSVLGYIGFGWMVASWIYLCVRSVKARIAIAVGILAAVTLVFGFFPAPDAVAGVARFSPEGHLGCWLDRVILGAHACCKTHEVEGFAGLPPTVVTGMLGIFAGEIVRRGGLRATGKKALALLGCAVLCAVLGFALSFFYPIVKKLWSPSFVLVVGGYSFAMFALFYWLVDVKGWVRGSFFFRVIGLNSITIYLVQRVVGFRAANGFLFGGLAGLFPSAWGQLVLAVGYVALCWAFLLFLYRKNVFLRV